MITTTTKGHMIKETNKMIINDSPRKLVEVKFPDTSAKMIDGIVKKQSFAKFSTSDFKRYSGECNTVGTFCFQWLRPPRGRRSQSQT